MANTVNTRLVLRNDQLSNWNASTKPLLKGEAALAQLSGDLSNYFQLRIGVDGTKTWKDLEPSNILIPINNVDGLTYSKYELRKVSVEGAYPIQYKLFGLKNKVLGGAEEWIAVSDTAIEIPEVDFSPVNGKIDYLSNAVSTITETTLPTAKTELSAALSSYTDTRITELSGAADATIAAVSAETLTKATADATTKANAASAEALIEAKAYTNSVSAELSSDYQGQINQIKDEIAGGIHFIGHVFDFGVDETKDPKEGWYQLNEGGEKKAAKAGDLIVKNEKEYIWSDAQKHWDEFGDEGNYATKNYVNDAKTEAINATKNAVYQENDLTDEQVTAYKADENKNVGDVLINKVTIAGDKQEFTAYMWNGTAWTAMDGNYSAANVYFKEDITLAGDYTAVGNIKLSDGKLPATGKSVKTLMDNIFTKELNPTKTLPTASVSTTATLTAEVGNTYTVPSATLKFTGVGSYTYGPETGISCEIGDATISCASEGTSNTNTAVLTKDGTVVLPAGTANAKTYTDSEVTYTFGGSLTYTDGNIPVTNLGNEYPAAQITSATLTSSATCKATGKRKRFWYVGTDCTTAVDNTFIRSTDSGHGSDFSTTTKTKDLAVPAGTTRVMFAFKGAATLKSVIDVDGMGLDIKDKFTTKTVAVEGANGFTAVDYTVFVFENPLGVSKTTMKITLN